MSVGITNSIILSCRHGDVIKRNVGKHNKEMMSWENMITNMSEMKWDMWVSLTNHYQSIGAVVGSLVSI